MENYSDIVLTPEETDEALRLCRKAKFHKLKYEEYKKRVEFKPSTPPKFTLADLQNYIQYNHPDFKIDDHNREIFKLLLLYFTDDERCEEMGISRKKGIVLYGPIGCGKTKMMEVFAANTFRPFVINPVRRITDRYADKKGGIAALNEFSSLVAAYPHQNFGLTHMGRCFDDLGTEDSRKNFGNEVNVMQDILYKIYDDKLMGNFHLTTNLSVDDIEDAYGKRIRSRFKEMFNILTFQNNAPDRRE